MRSKIEFNFALRWEQALSIHTGAHLKRKKRQQLLILFVGVIVILAGTTWPWLWMYKLQNDLEEVNQKIANLSSTENQVRQLDALKLKNTQQIEVINQIKGSNIDPEPILNKMAKLFPAGTTINSFSLTADKNLTMSVSIPTPIDLAKLWISLRDSGLFQTVDVKTFSLVDKVQTLSLSLKLK